MTDRTVRVILTAATQQFDAAMQKAAGSAKALQSNMQKTLESGDLQPLQGPLVAYGTAMTAVGAAVAKTGIEYNTLQQTSRAALTTLTGSAQAANAQMDKLDDFARTSPFSKSTFITAQQQMLAFGIEAEKVVPYLSAINEATAAAGGNNQTLGELAFIMAQIGAAGKITAQDLMQFGQRGVNAAELIGSQMGKTGAQIRDDITNGALDANAALDALADGMEERFGGASANVKNTMEGAFDRVKAAWRDLSASIMEPAVGQSGGGFLVDLTNTVADFIRAVEKLPDPVKQAGAALGGISGAAALAAGGLLVAVPKIVEMNAAWKTLGTTMPGVARVLSGLGPAAVAAGVAIAAIGKFIQPTLEWHARAREVVEEYSNALAENTDLLADNAAATDESIRKIVAKRLQEEGLLDMASTLGASLADVTSAVLGEAEALERVQGAAQAYVDGIEAVIAAKERERDALAAGGVMTEEQAIKYSDLGIELEELGRKASDATGMQRQLLYAVGDEESRFQKGVEGARELKEEQEQVAEAAAAAIDPTQQLADAVGATGEAASDAASDTLEFALETAAAAEAAEAAEKEWVDYLNALAGGSQTFTSLGKAMDVFADDATASLDKYLDALEEQIAAQNNWEANMLELSGRASRGLIDHLAKMGAEGAPLVAALVDATDEELTRMERNFRESGSQSSMDWAEGLAEGAAVWAALGQKMGSDVVREAAQEVAEGKATLQGIIDRYDLTAELEADTGPATREVTDILAWVAQQRASVQVDADTSAAERAARAALNRISSMTANMSVTARVGVYHRNGFDAPMAQGGKVGDAVAAYQGMSDGGRVYGPGTTTSDEAALIALSHGEFVIREWAARMIGYDTLEYANNTGRLPTEHRMQATPAAYTVNYAVPQGQQSEVHNHYQIDRLEFPGVRVAAEMERAMEKLPELAQQRGVRRG